jgi:sirohydrochlorin cobaltochelatase
MTTPSPARKGVILFAHGSRDPLWHKPMEAVAACIRASDPHAEVVCAYLELSSPDLATACALLLDRGIHCISILPLFLGVGKHAREDLPLLVADLRKRYPATEFVLQPAVGEDNRLISLLAAMALESLHTQTP